jgi:hypothetical protein
VEDAEQVFFYGVLAKAQFPSGFAITQAFGHEGHHLFFARGKHLTTSRVQHPQRRHPRNQIDQESHLFGIGPDLTVGNPLNALAKQPKMRIGNAENTVGRADPPLTAKQNAPPDFSRLEVTEEDLNSEVELLRDDDVLRRVVQANNLGARDWLRWLRPHEGDAARTERAAKKLAGQLKVEALKKTNLIAPSYDSPDPETAAHVLQSLTAIYVEKHMEVHRPAGQLRFFDQQTEESRRQLEAAKNKLLDFTNTHGVVMAAQQRDLVLRRIDEADANYRQAQVEMSEAARRARELNAQLTNLPERTITQIRTADNPELLRTLKGSLLDLELKRTQLLTKFEPKHRLVQEVEQQIVQTQAAIAAESQTQSATKLRIKMRTTSGLKANCRRQRLRWRDWQHEKQRPAHIWPNTAPWPVNWGRHRSRRMI